MDHGDISTTKIYAHVPNRGGLGVRVHWTGPGMCRQRSARSDLCGGPLGYRIPTAIAT
jgi:hypothetical protein